MMGSLLLLLLLLATKLNVVDIFANARGVDEFPFTEIRSWLLWTISQVTLNSQGASYVIGATQKTAATAPDSPSRPAESAHRLPGADSGYAIGGIALRDNVLERGQIGASSSNHIIEKLNDATAMCSESVVTFSSLV
jgi:hypothetical protein